MPGVSPFSGANKFAPSYLNSTTMRRYCLLGFCPLLFLLRSFGQTNSSCTVTPAGPVMLCPGGSQVLTAGAGTAYLWSTGETAQSITVTKGGNYSVAIDNCYSNTVQVIEAAITPSHPSLCNGSAVLKASGPPEWKTFNWNGPGSFTTATMNIGPYTNVTDLMIGNTNAFVYGDPYRYPKLTFSIDLYNPATNTWVSVYSGTIYFDAVQLKGLSLSFPNISTVSQIRLSSSGSSGYYSIEGFNQVQNTPFTISEHANPFTYLWSTGATTQQITVTQTGNYSVSINGCPAVSTTVTGIPGDPAVFGQNAWNVYAWNEGDGTLAGSAWQKAYSGYYTDASFSFSTRNKWGLAGAPSDADTYRGCPVDKDNHSWSAKRQGFPCGQYNISVTGHDDAAQLFVDGVKVWEHECCDAGGVVWTGYLNANSKIEFRATEGGGNSHGSIDITMLKPVITSDSYSTVCPGHPIVLTATTTGSGYLWSTGATTQSITVTQPGVYTVKETDNCGNKIESEPFTVSGLVAPQTYPSGTVTADACTGSVDLYAYLPDDPYGQGYTFAWYKTGVTTPVSTNDYFSATTTGDYYIVVSRNGCSSPPSNPVHVTVPSKGDPSVFGNNVWNVYVWADLNGYPTYYNVPNYDYQGYYTENNLSFDTRDRWDADWGSPANVSGYTGCGYNLYGDYFKWTAKRKGFTCGRYSISIPAYDDDASLIVNGTTVWQSTCCSNAVNPVWEGVLGPDSKVEFTVAEYEGLAFGAITFTLLDAKVVAKPVITPAGPVNICSNSSVTLTSGSATGNKWSTGATTQSIVVNTAGNYSVTVTGSQGCTAQSDAVQVTVTQATTWYRDADNDGYGTSNTTMLACTKPVGYVALSGDCNDGNSSVNPGKAEICGNNIDDNCDGQIDEGCNNKALLSIGDATLTEGAASVTLTVTLSKKTAQDVTVTYATADGTARSKANKNNPADFVDKSGTLTIAAGTQSATVTITLLNDNVYEGTEQFYVQLKQPDNAGIDKGTGTVTITDDDAPATLAAPTAKSEATAPKEAFAEKLSVSALPNPSPAYFNVVVNGNGSGEKITVQVSDMLGRKIEERVLSSQQQTLSLGEQYKAGVYLVRFVQGSESKTLKLVKVSQ